MKLTNRQIWEAWISLERLGEAPLPPFSIGMRLALNRNFLRPLRDAIEAKRRELVEQHQVGSAHPQDAGRPVRLAAFTKDWDAVLDEKDIEWEACAKIPQERFQDQHKDAPIALNANDLASLIAAGIITLTEGKEDTKK